MTKPPNPAHLTSRDREAARMQRRIRQAMADYAMARIGQDALTTFAALQTEFIGGMFELMNAHGYAPTEAQFVASFAAVAGVVARGEHYQGAQTDKAGRA
jgi:hypothetical protein